MAALNKNINYNFNECIEISRMFHFPRVRQVGAFLPVQSKLKLVSCRRSVTMDALSGSARGREHRPKNAIVFVVVCSSHGCRSILRSFFAHDTFQLSLSLVRPFKNRFDEPRPPKFSRNNSA